MALTHRAWRVKAHVQSTNLSHAPYNHKYMRVALAPQVKLKHPETKAYLSSSTNNRFGRPIAGQLEVCGRKKAGKNEEWMATEGLYFPERTDAE